MGSGNSTPFRNVLGLTLVALILSGGAAFAACSEGVISLRGKGLAADFNVEVADDEAERARGLMYRRAMPRGSGMLFIYPHPQQVAFWMKNTFIPLDLIFLDGMGVVKHVHPDAIPQDLTAILGGQGILAVLEINAGLARSMGIVPGVEMRHPAFGGAAAWAC